MYWDEQFDQVDRSYGVLSMNAPFQVGFLEIDRPIWIRRDAELENYCLCKDGPLVVLTMPSVSYASGETSKLATVGKTNMEGAFTRGAILKLCESLAYSTSSTVKILAAQSTGRDAEGFVLFGSPATLHDFSIAMPKSAEWIIFLNLEITSEVWQLEVKLIAVKNELLMWSNKFDVDKLTPFSTVVTIADQLIHELTKLGAVKLRTPPTWIGLLVNEWQDSYLACSEKALAIAAFQDTPASLYQIRSIFDQLLLLSASNPAHAPSALMYLLSLVRAKEKFQAEVQEYARQTEDLEMTLQLEAFPMQQFRDLKADLFQ